METKREPRKTIIVFKEVEKKKTKKKHSVRKKKPRKNTSHKAKKAAYKKWYVKKCGPVKHIVPGKLFYNTREWRELRYKAFEKNGNNCQCCGVHSSKKQLHVDHIKPRSLYPELELELSNLQILCCDCNLGKSNKFSTDWRT